MKLLAVLKGFGSGFGVFSPPEVDRIWGILLGLYGDNGKENGNYYNGLYMV